MTDVGFSAQNQWVLGIVWTRRKKPSIRTKNQTLQENVPNVRNSTGEGSFSQRSPMVRLLNENTFGFGMFVVVDVDDNNIA
jgi:hypothetical protein